MTQRTALIAPTVDTLTINKVTDEWLTVRLLLDFYFGRITTEVLHEI